MSDWPSFVNHYVPGPEVAAYISTNSKWPDGRPISQNEILVAHRLEIEDELYLEQLSEEF